jgi:hypothetical protein
MTASQEARQPEGREVIVSVGQCGFDNSQIRELVRAVAPGFEVKFADDLAETAEILGESHGRVRLVLVNRILDADGSRGVDLIRTIKSGSDRFGPVPLMLVSDLESAQAQAIAEGALPGFGKSSLRSVQTRDRLRQAIESVN